MSSERPQLDESPTRRARLLDAQLRGLISEHRGAPVDAASAPLPIGAGLIVASDDGRDVASDDGRDVASDDGRDVASDDGRDAWVLLDAQGGARPARALGPALAWAIRQRASRLNIISAVDGGMLARRAGHFDLPIDVWFPQERELLPVVEEPLPVPPAAVAAHLAFADEIVDAGADVVVEHGVVTGEAHGLEVCRVVDGSDGVARLEVGVGAQDRDAFGLLHGDQPPEDALAQVVAHVVRQRSPDAPQHPLNRIAGERLLRWSLVQDPGAVDLIELVAAAPPVPRGGLNEMDPCVALGRDGAGADVVVVVSSGVDLDLLPFVADVRLEHDRPVVVALPARDRLPITDELAALIGPGVELRSVG
ncbi:MAG: hypothetical protein AAGF73_14055 [Actinomycetota bacterium]